MPEVKQYTLGRNLTSQDTPPAGDAPALYHILTLNNIGSGDGKSERSGLRIENESLELRMKVAVDPNSDASNANVVADAHEFRIVVYLDKISSGGAPTWGTLFEPAPNGDGQLYSYPSLQLKKRFQILDDRFVRVGKSMVVHDGSNFHSYGNLNFSKFEIPLKHTTWFSDGTTNLAAIQEGNIGVFIASDASSTTYPKMKFSFRSRLRYSDY